MYVLNPFFLRMASLFCGISLLWYGSSHASIAGLIVMFMGLAAAVGGVMPPRPSLQHQRTPVTFGSPLDPSRRRITH